jgi:hypothetical protein
MGHSRSVSWRRRLTAAWALGVVWAVAGCGSSDVVPVSGRVTVDGEPLKARGGVVNFVPMKDKGNATEIQPTGYVDENGNYTVYYAQGKKGAPPGWYKVQVAGIPPGEGPLQMPRPDWTGPPPKPAPLFNGKFTRADTSDIEIEVVRNPAPGAYDIKLTK